MSRRSMEGVDTADGDATDRVAPVVGDVATAKHPQYRDSAKVSRASRRSGGRDTDAHLKKNEDKKREQQAQERSSRCQR
ncbi:hypothetical protein MTO96_003248 [Rhipicephalus appendiculatus]